MNFRIGSKNNSALLLINRARETFITKIKWDSLTLLKIATTLNDILNTISHNPYDDESEAIINEAYDAQEATHRTEYLTHKMFDFNRTMLFDIFQYVALIQRQRLSVLSINLTGLGIPTLFEAFSMLDEEIHHKSCSCTIKSAKEYKAPLKGRILPPEVAKSIFDHWIANFTNIYYGDTPARTTTPIPSLVSTPQEPAQQGFLNVLIQLVRKRLGFFSSISG